jgi:hypothetical protein
VVSGGGGSVIAMAIDPHPSKPDIIIVRTLFIRFSG